MNIERGIIVVLTIALMTFFWKWHWATAELADLKLMYSQAEAKAADTRAKALTEQAKAFNALIHTERLRREALARDNQLLNQKLTTMSDYHETAPPSLLLVINRMLDRARDVSRTSGTNVPASP